MVNHKLRIQLKTALEKLQDTTDKKELYRILLISKKNGFEWGQRTMYGGGTNVVIYDNHDIVAELTIIDNVINIEFHELYFHENYVPTEIIYYNDEQLAEIRNEEALYGYEMSHYRVVDGYIKEA